MASLICCILQPPLSPGFKLSKEAVTCDYYCSAIMKHTGNNIISQRYTSDDDSENEMSVEMFGLGGDSQG